MAMITWNPTYSVGVTLFDDQHKVLIQMLNDLHEAMMQGKGRDAVGPIIQGLLDYTATHFASEEQRFEATGYPLTAEHMAIHANFVNKVKDFQKEYAENQFALSLDLMDFLQDWLVEHIQGADQKYTEHMHAHGVS